MVVKIQFLDCDELFNHHQCQRMFCIFLRFLLRFSIGEEVSAAGKEVFEASAAGEDVFAVSAWGVKEKEAKQLFEVVECTCWSLSFVSAAWLTLWVSL